MQAELCGADPVESPCLAVHKVAAASPILIIEATEPDALPAYMNPDDSFSTVYACGEENASLGDPPDHLF